MDRYSIRLTPHMVYTVYAESPDNARLQVWNDIKDVYNFGYTSLDQIPQPEKCDPLLAEKIADRVMELKQIKKDLQEAQQ